MGWNGISAHDAGSAQRRHTRELVPDEGMGLGFRCDSVSDLFLTATGIYLWTILKAERRVGLIFLGSGMLSFVLIVVAMVG